MTRELTQEDIDRIESKLEWEGLEEYLMGGWAEEDFQGTVLEVPLVYYVRARAQLLTQMAQEGIDV